MSQATHKTARQLLHSIIATMCGCLLWYSIAEKITITQTKEIPIHVYNINDTKENICFPPTTLVTICVSPLTLLSTDTNNLSVHIDAQKLKENTTIITNYHDTIILPKDIKIVHCNPITIHKITNNTFS